MPSKQRNFKDLRPTLHAVALSRLRYILGPLVARAFTGREAFILERGKIPVAALVSAREWLEYLESRYPGISTAVQRGDIAKPQRRASRARHLARKSKPRQPSLTRAKRKQAKQGLPTSNSTRRGRLRSVRTRPIAARRRRGRRRARAV
jgi:hypothetical protein